MRIAVREFKHVPGENDAEYIKLLKKALDRQKQITAKAVAKIKQLSAQPKLFGISEQLPCGDTISRQDAIDLAYWHGEKHTSDNPYPNGVEAVDVSDLEKIPSVQPARKQGKWIWNDHYGVYRCEKCGQVAPQEDQYGCYMGRSRFCPNCGADMSEEEK